MENGKHIDINYDMGERYRPLTQGHRRAHRTRYVKRLTIPPSCLEESDWPNAGAFEVAIGVCISST